MTYIENPKTKSSGIICCIPQKGKCPNNCSDCFFQSGRSYLEPLEKNLPNIPNYKETENRIIRINDGNDSNVDRAIVVNSTVNFSFKNFFYNTAIPKDLEEFRAPVVLTINPGKYTNVTFYKVNPIPKNLMFVRVRTNTWNLNDIVKPAVKYYSEREVPIVLTFMAYYDTMDKIPEHHKKNYVFRKRTLNSYNAITTKGWIRTMRLFRDNKWVHSCGKIEGEKGDTHCRFCGNCLREYFATMERLRGL